MKLSTVSITVPETFCILVKLVGKIKRNLYRVVFLSEKESLGRYGWLNEAGF